MPIINIDPNEAFLDQNTNLYLNQDDLSISVELTVDKKSRSIVTVQNGTVAVQDNGKPMRINFIEGSKVNDRNVLTTNYLNATTEYEETAEGLGITDIEIKFNTAYTPQININFIDVRGNVMANGNNSKYRVFFDLPYPIFKLTVKGYYGKAVTYCLHMVKWNSNFNSNTGNFEINCEFIGYTYAMLTDALMGVIKSIPYTKIGKQVYDEITAEYKKNHNINIIPIPDMIIKLGEYSNSVEEFSQNSKEYKEIKKSQEKYKDITKLKDIISAFFIKITDVKNKPSMTDNATYAASAKGVTDDDVNKFNEDVRVQIEKVGISLSSPYEIIARNVNSEMFRDAQNNKETFSAKKHINDCSKHSYDTENFIENTRLHNLVLKLCKDGDIGLQPNSFVVYDIYKLTKAINDKITEVNRNDIEARVNLSKKLRENFKTKTGFDPNIENIMAIFIAHIEIMFTTICKVSSAAEDNIERQDILNNLLNYQSTYYNNIDDDKIYPWPTYYKEGTESWLGEDVSNTTLVNELTFTEELFSQMIEQYKKEEDAIQEIESANMWNPIGPYDTPINKVTKNPYIKANTDTEPSINEKYPLRLLMYRCFLYLGNENIYLGEKKGNDSLSNDYVSKFEAMNMFYGVSDKTIRKAIMTNYESSDKIIEYFLNPKKADKDENDEPYMKLIDEDYVYTYISGNTNNGGSAQIIPIDSNIGYGRNLFISGNTITSGTINNKTSNHIKIISKSDYENIATSFKLLIPKDTELNDAYVKDPEFKDKYPTRDEIKDNFENEKPSIPSPATNVMNVFEFNKLESADGDSVAALFFFNSDSGTRLIDKGEPGLGHKEVFNKSMKNPNLKGISTSDITYEYTNKTGFLNTQKEHVVSLFGSPLYYAQKASKEENMAKAFLFLNTIPLVIMEGMIDEYEDEDEDENSTSKDLSKVVSNLFSNNSAIINTPKCWVNWIGSLIWREDYYNENEIDPIVSKCVVDGNIAALVPTKVTITGSSQSAYPAHNKLTLNNYKQTYSYPKLTIDLPKSVREVFKIQFKHWATKEEGSTGFIAVRNKLDILSLSNLITINQAGQPNLTVWQDTVISQLDNGILGVTSPMANSNSNYSEITPQYRGPSEGPLTPVQESASSNRNVVNDFELTTNYTTETNNLVYAILTTTFSISNHSPRIFNNLRIKPTVSYSYGTPVPITQDAITANTLKKKENFLIKIDKNKLKSYLDGFCFEYKKLCDDDVNDEKESDNDAKMGIFHNNDNNSIKLHLYRHLSAINNKWISGNHSGFYPCSNVGNKPCKYRIYETFKFIDKAHTPIGNTFIINAESLSKRLKSNWNQSFYDLMGNILSDNGFNFIALPTYINFSSETSITESLFKPYSYNETLNSSGPSFICMYAGQPSTSLDIGGNNFPDDGVQFTKDNIAITTTKMPAAEQWNKGNVIVFDVKYASDNQNIFKNIKLDQREFSETLESLVIQDDISKNGQINKMVTPIGQNLFNVYQTRSYNAVVESMGSATIQPMMHFQLKDIPMFRGGYLITSVSHSIKPNHMTTTFTGNRVRNTFTPIVEDTYAIKSLDLIDAVVPTKYSITDGNNRNVTENKPNTKKPVINKNESTPISDGNSSIYDYNYGKSIKKYGFKSEMFDKESRTKKNNEYMTYNEIFTEIADKFNFSPKTLKTIAVIESSVGNASTVKNNEPNGSGYVGLMQFGNLATSDVRESINTYINNAYKINIQNYEFSAELQNNRIKTPENWSADALTNNTSTNTMYDDYISTLAMVYYALKYNDINGDDFSKIVDIYLTHQQGAKGLNNIITYPLTELEDGSDQSKRMKSNMPLFPNNDSSTIKTYRDWYLGWAGRINAIAYEVNQL